MSMDPGMIMALMSAITGTMGALNGNEGEQKSSFSQGQQGGINDILNMVKGMKGQGDITKNQNYQHGNEWLNNLFNDPSFFQNIEAPAMRQFNEEIIPGVANRFASMGSGGSLGSTAFRNQVNREGANLASNLSAQRTGMQQQGVNQGLQYAQQPFQNMMALYNQALGQPINNQYQPPSAGGWGSMAAPLMQGATSYWGGQGGQQNLGGQGGNTGQAPSTQENWTPPPNMSRTYPGQ